MQIKEVSKQTGLSIKTIRFYTERNLVAPKKEERNGRTYKDFSQKDLERLHMIAVLRKCLFSIEQIKTMIDHPELTPDVFSEYREELLTQAELLKVLAEKAVTMDPDTLDGPEVLARKLTHTATPLPLPRRDLDPHFGKLDPETPEERHAAFLKWQKRYKHRHLWRIIPAVIIFLLLTTATVIQANMSASSNIASYIYAKDKLFTTTWAFDWDRYADSIIIHETQMVYGLYDTNGELLPYHIAPGNETVLKNPSVPEIVEDVMEDEFGTDILYRNEKLDKALAEWIATISFSPHHDHELIRSNIFSQTFAFAHSIEINDEPYYLAFYYHTTPLSQVFFKHTGIFYLAALFIYGVVYALSATRGYGFQVRFMRQYGTRGTWNDAIIHIDEKTGKGTMLTKQWGGMSNLMHSDYRDEE